MDIEKVVENIQRICKDRGITPTEAGKKSGAGKDLVSLMKRRGSFPSIERISLLADYLGVTTSELLGEKMGLAPIAGDEPIYPPEYDFLSPEDKELIDNMIRSLSKKQQAITAGLHIPPKDKADSEMSQSDEDIDREVEDYRRRLILEKNQEVGSSPSNGAGSETA